MPIPHYLHKAPSGVFHFRRRMPSCLHALVSRPVTKRSLLTRDVGVARDLASDFGVRMMSSINTCGSWPWQG